MIEREIDYRFFLNKKVEVILNNSMHYNGIVISVGDTFFKLKTIKGEDAFIVLDMISSVVDKEDKR